MLRGNVLIELHAVKMRKECYLPFLLAISLFTIRRIGCLKRNIWLFFYLFYVLLWNGFLAEQMVENEMFFIEPSSLPPKTVAFGHGNLPWKNLVQDEICSCMRTSVHTFQGKGAWFKGNQLQQMLIDKGRYHVFYADV